MRRKIIFFLVSVLALFSSSAGQSPSESSTPRQIQQRIFAVERRMIAGLRYTSPVLETYLQSLWPQANGQSPIDDAYFLSSVDFTSRSSPNSKFRRGRLIALDGRRDSGSRVRVNNGNKWSLNPDGYLDMFFVDMEDFDPDTYELKFLQEDDSSGRNLLFSVIPKMASFQGRFTGLIWVEPSTFNITRIKGTFTPPPVTLLKRIVGGTIPMYFHFESVRQEVQPGIWLPSYTYFEEDRTWKQINHNGETGFHYRGHSFMWGYTDSPNPLINGSGLLAHLQNQKLLGNPGSVERELDEIIDSIIEANNLNVGAIHCRVLLTSPVELIHTSDSIFLSRGLLNIVPADSVVPILLSHEISEILLSHLRTEDPARNPAEVWKMATELARKAGYSVGLLPTSSLLTQLAKHAKQVPNLIASRFGPNFLQLLSTMPEIHNKTWDTSPPSTLTLRGKYTIDTWNSSLIVRNETSRNKPQTLGYRYQAD